MAACFNKEVPWSRRGQRKLRRHPFRRRPISGLKPREPGNLLVLTPRRHLLRRPVASRCVHLWSVMQLKLM